ncbi:Asp-tRNA(Asn)/Glu-tRNA(Gln) amidotransferase GatCAB subunit C [Candidatus Saccharibacteria bacterium]|nr:MAG: Asp-tRNA(Asn)/Glu-tRNA(Gln) amidotransferase GatCAB subunit C [Candidatus Saccharibacteria bacterium]
MTDVSTDDVQTLADLSALSLDDDEAEGLRDDIANILSYVAQLGSLDTSDVPPTYQVTGLANVWRDDEIVESSVSTDELLAEAPAAANNQFKVPKVL